MKHCVRLTSGYLEEVVVHSLIVIRVRLHGAEKNYGESVGAEARKIQTM